MTKFNSHPYCNYSCEGHNTKHCSSVDGVIHDISVRKSWEPHFVCKKKSFIFWVTLHNNSFLDFLWWAVPIIVLLRNYVSLGFPNTVSRDVGINIGSGFKIFMKLVTVILWENLIAISCEFQNFLKLRGVIFNNT